MDIESLLKIDWTLWLERRGQPPFFAATFCHVEGKMLEEAVGRGFTHNVCIYDHGRMLYLRSQKELEEVDICCLAFIKDIENYSKIEQWVTTGNDFYSKNDELLKNFAALWTDEYIVNHYDEVMKLCYDILFYTTSLPYFLLSGINYGIEKGENNEHFTEIMNLIGPLRAKSSYTQMIDVVFKKYWTLAAQKSGKEEEFFSSLTPKELGDYFAGNISIEDPEFQGRLPYAVYGLDVASNTVQVIADVDKKLKKVIEAAHDTTIREFKGSVAFKGLVKGVVRVVNSESELSKMNEGEVLVSISTNPALMPAIIKCSAIVTDEGGIGCHAAIIARELKKPCVIGTKIATQVLKDGDVVEVDADSGIVRIVSV